MDGNLDTRDKDYSLDKVLANIEAARRSLEEQND